MSDSIKKPSPARSDMMEAERAKLHEMHNEDGDVGWYFDCDGHYIDVERDADGKYSVYFRNRADDSAAWFDQTESAPSGESLDDFRALFEEWAQDPIRADKLPLERHANGAYKDTRSYLVGYGWKSGYRAALARRATAGNAALEGRTVSVDVSTSEEDAGNRIFANLTGETGSDGTTLLAYEVSRNFAGNAAPVLYVRQMDLDAKPSNHSIIASRSKSEGEWDVPLYLATLAATAAPGDLLADINSELAAFDTNIGHQQALLRRAAEYLASNAGSAPGRGPRYTCVGKGGDYELIGEATGAGTARDGFKLAIYRDATSGRLFYRTTADFNERMAPSNSPVGAKEKA